MVNPIFDDAGVPRDDGAAIAMNAFFVPDATVDKVEVAKSANKGVVFASLVHKLFLIHIITDGRRTLVVCPDPKLLYHHADIKLERKMSIFYREAQDVCVYNTQGSLVDVDELPETLYPGSAVVANVVLN